MSVSICRTVYRSMSVPKEDEEVPDFTWIEFDSFSCFFSMIWKVTRHGTHLLRKIPQSL